MGDVFENFIAAVITACQSDFYHIYLNSSEEKWIALNANTSIFTSENLALVTDFVRQQVREAEVPDVMEDNRFNEQKVFINEQRIRHFFSTPLISNNGLLIGYICIFSIKSKRLNEHQKLMVNLLARDIILQVNLLKKDHQLQENVQLRNALNKELDEFTYLASHDLSSPLNAIKSVVTWVEEDVDNGVTTDTPKYFKMIKNSIERMNSLLKDLGSYSRLRCFDDVPEQFNLKEIVAKCCEILGTTQNFDFQVESCEFELPKQPIILIFTQLISNIVKHHHKGIGAVKVYGFSYAEYYELSITDDGPGIAPEFQSKIFKPFQKLKSKDEVESSGLGLAVVKKIVGRYGGNITLDSELGSGSVFKIMWPKTALIKT